MTVFKEPKPNECLQRWAVVLKYAQLLMVNSDAKDFATARAILSEFVDATYSRSLLLADYISLFTKYSDAESREALCAHLSALKCECERVGDCAGTARHFRGRTETQSKEEKEEKELFLGLIDTVHFNVFHLEHLGLRVPSDSDAHEQKDDEMERDEHDLVDTEMRRIAKQIHRLRSLSAFPRIESTKNSKFTLQTSEEKEATDGTAKGISIFAHFAVFCFMKIRFQMK